VIGNGDEGYWCGKVVEMRGNRLKAEENEPHDEKRRDSLLNLDFLRFLLHFG
jgi:hypothetical protein